MQQRTFIGGKRLSHKIGRLVAGDKKYKKIQYRGARWPDYSKAVRERDGKCLKCGSTKRLEADHFHKSSYLWKRAFFSLRRIQTLCFRCHIQLPSMKVRVKNGWKKYCYVSWVDDFKG